MDMYSQIMKTTSSSVLVEEDSDKDSDNTEPNVDQETALRQVIFFAEYIVPHKLRELLEWVPAGVTATHVEAHTLSHKMELLSQSLLRQPRQLLLPCASTFVAIPLA